MTPTKSMTDSIADAVSKGQTDRVLALLDSGADINTANAAGLTLLMLAAKKGCLEIVRALLDRGAAVNTQATYYGWTALTYAANAGHEEIVRLLLEQGAALNAKAVRGKTALVVAADRGHTAVVAALLEAGADASAPPDHHGWTALGRAVKNRHFEVVLLLQAAEAEQRKRDNNNL